MKEIGGWTNFYKNTPQDTFSKPSQPDISAVKSEQIVLGAPVSTETTIRTLGCVSYGIKLNGMGFELS